jgi:hypothetical protein
MSGPLTICSSTDITRENAQKLLFDDRLHLVVGHGCVSLHWLSRVKPSAVQADYPMSVSRSTDTDRSTRTKPDQLHMVSTLATMLGHQ